MKLTITSDDGAEGLVEKEVHIHALYGGTIIAINGKRIRSLFFNRQAYEILWEDNPMNASNNYPAISTYEIWRAPQGSNLTESSYTKVGDVSASVHEFLDYQDVVDGVSYVYAVRSIDAEGHISPLTSVSTSSSNRDEAVLLNKDKK